VTWFSHRIPKCMLSHVNTEKNVFRIRMIFFQIVKGHVLPTTHMSMACMMSRSKNLPHFLATLELTRTSVQSRKTFSSVIPLMVGYSKTPSTSWSWSREMSPMNMYELKDKQFLQPLVISMCLRNVFWISKTKSFVSI